MESQNLSSDGYNLKAASNAYVDHSYALNSKMDKLSSLDARKQNLTQYKYNLIGRLITYFEEKSLESQISKLERGIQKEFKKLKDRIEKDDSYFIKRIKIGDFGGDKNEYIKQLGEFIDCQKTAVNSVNAKIQNLPIIAKLAPQGEALEREIDQNDKIRQMAILYTQLEKGWKKEILEKGPSIQEAKWDTQEHFIKTGFETLKKAQEQQGKSGIDPQAYKEHFDRDLFLAHVKNIYNKQFENVEKQMQALLVESTFDENTFDATHDILKQFLDRLQIADDPDLSETEKACRTIVNDHANKLTVQISDDFKVQIRNAKTDDIKTLLNDYLDKLEKIKDLTNDRDSLQALQKRREAAILLADQAFTTQLKPTLDKLATKPEIATLRKTQQDLQTFRSHLLTLTHEPKALQTKFAEVNKKMEQSFSQMIGTEWQALEKNSKELFDPALGPNLKHLKVFNAQIKEFDNSLSEGPQFSHSEKTSTQIIEMRNKLDQLLESIQKQIPEQIQDTKIRLAELQQHVKDAGDNLNAAIEAKKAIETQHNRYQKDEKKIAEQKTDLLNQSLLLNQFPLSEKAGEDNVGEDPVMQTLKKIHQLEYQKNLTPKGRETILQDIQKLNIIPADSIPSNLEHPADLLVSEPLQRVFTTRLDSLKKANDKINKLIEKVNAQLHDLKEIKNESSLLDKAQRQQRELKSKLTQIDIAQKRLNAAEVAIKPYLESIDPHMMPEQLTESVLEQNQHKLPPHLPLENAKRVIRNWQTASKATANAEKETQQIKEQLDEVNRKVLYLQDLPKNSQAYKTNIENLAKALQEIGVEENAEIVTSLDLPKPSSGGIFHKRIDPQQLESIRKQIAFRDQGQPYLKEVVLHQKSKKNAAKLIATNETRLNQLASQQEKIRLSLAQYQKIVDQSDSLTNEAEGASEVSHKALEFTEQTIEASKNHMDTLMQTQQFLTDIQQNLELLNTKIHERQSEKGKEEAA